MTDLTLADIEQARVRIRGQIISTPLIDVTLPGRGRVAMKPEYLQSTGSFKIRGAANCIAQLSPEQKQRGVIAYSTGNHAQAVALAARVVGAPATIVMSPDVPHEKLDGTRDLDADILLAKPSSEARRRLAEDTAREQGLALIPPYDDSMVMAGQGTIGLEILSEILPAAVYVPIGGGGLIAGIAAAIKQKVPSVRVIGVEPLEESDSFQSWTLGQRVRLPGPSNSIADAIKVQIPGERTFPVMQRYVDDIVLVGDSRIIEAMRLYHGQTGHRVEPAGTIALAAVMASEVTSDRPVICIGTGQNITEARFRELTGL